jgi:2-dehydro-3-deoxy-D-gluconate 5-dehydrogenase
MQINNNILKGFSLEGKIAIITATTRGLGQSLAEALAEAGATIIALDRSENDHLPEFCDKLGRTFKRIKVDLMTATKSDLQKIIDSVMDEYSQIDILVNNAGITRRGDIPDFLEEDWNEVLKINLSTPFYLSQIVSKIFINQRYGKIINVASILSFQGGIRVPSYVSSKHGLVGLTRSFAVALAPYGINVNAIAPGCMVTDMTSLLRNDKERNNLITKRTPAGRWGVASDLKGVVIFLASGMSDYVNGAVIPVDGGWLAS